MTRRSKIAAIAAPVVAALALGGAGLVQAIGGPVALLSRLGGDPPRDGPARRRGAAERER